MKALISVYDKSNIVEFASGLLKLGIEILSTGGTSSILRNAGIDVTDVSDYTGHPEILGGRVKTLHPRIHGGILARRGIDDYADVLDIVVVNLYPFEATIRSGAVREEIIEQIDIGGVALMRAAAKNNVCIISNPNDYDEALNELCRNHKLSEEFRRKLSAKAFAITAQYDTAISQWMNGGIVMQLRYGENSHQRAEFRCSSGSPFQQLQGKELSYNNIIDVDAAWSTVQEFDDPAVAVVKHTNPCGVAIHENIGNAYKEAYGADSISAFGSVIALNRSLSIEIASDTIKRFIEIIIAPSIDQGVLEVLKVKPNVRVLIMEKIDNNVSIKSVIGGVLHQDRNICDITESDMRVMTDTHPIQAQIKDMLFAFKVCAHVKSNAIVTAKDCTTLGIGAGQPNRVQSVRLATDNKECQNAVLASDAFFPFADSIDTAAKAGISAIIQPGGSKADSDVIEACNKAGIAMVFTGKRMFLH